MSKYEIRKCKSCGKEFEPKRKNQVNCKASCPQEQKILFGGGITRRGNTITVKGALNCALFWKGLL
jgi:DNA-directed RNA polymerase subunit RPC12/RpoP